MTRQMMFAISRGVCHIIGNFVALFAGRNHEIRAAAVRRPRTTPLDYRVGVTLGPHAALAVSRTTFLLYGRINTAFGTRPKINPKNKKGG
jgi:hypothetical protein